MVNKSPKAPPNLNIDQANLATSLVDLLDTWEFLPNCDLFSNHSLRLQSYVKHIEGLSTSNSEFKLLSGNGQKNEGSWLAGIRRLNWDSNFFQTGIGRIEPFITPPFFPLSDSSISLGNALIEGLINEAKKLSLKHLSVAVDCGDSASHHILEQNQFNIMDTIIGYRLPLTKKQDFSVSANISEHETDDIEDIVAIAGECFSSRKHNINRFNSDKFFSDKQVRLFYEEWMKLSVKHEWADKVWVYREDRKAIGFITCKLPAKHFAELNVNLCNIPLNAIDPNYHGQGIYTKLVHAALNWFQKQGVSVVEIRTQLGNQAVHKTWFKLGASPSLIYHTFHRTISL